MVLTDDVPIGGRRRLRDSPSLAPLRSRDFSIMWIGALFSNIGTWMETVALGYYVADTTGKASWSAVVAAAGFVPGAIVGPVGSAMADRLRRRRVLVITNAIAAVIAAFLAWWVGTGDATPVGLALLAFVAGAVVMFGFPSFQVSLPDLVPASTSWRPSVCRTRSGTSAASSGRRSLRSRLQREASSSRCGATRSASSP